MPGRGRRPRLTANKLDKLNSDIVERVNASGRAYLTQTKLRGRTVMRIGLGNVLTTEEHLAQGVGIDSGNSRSVIDKRHPTKSGRAPPHSKTWP